MAKQRSVLIPRALQIFFRLLYTRFAFLYDVVAWTSSMGQWRKWQSAVLIEFEPGVILEVGHGPGYGQLDLKQAGYASVALDPSRQMNKLARRRLTKAGYKPDIVCGRAQALPFAHQAFSGLMSTFPSEYIFDPETLAEAYRVLPQGASFSIVGIVEITGKSLPDRFARWLYKITGQSGSIPTGWTEYFQEFGFTPRLEVVTTRRSKVTRVVAVRQQGPPRLSLSFRG
jgi:ubiquinone/menaquinone biosynthesis C-methylase UbiE